MGVEPTCDTLVPHDGFEARARHRPRLASTAIIADRCVGSPAKAKLEKHFVGIAFPRSSNGRTAAFGAVNRGSNPCRGATTFLPQFLGRVSLTARAPFPWPVSATFRRFSGVAGALWFEERFRGGASSTPGLRPNPAFSLANSPVSPVDRKRLLTASSNAGCRQFSSNRRTPSDFTEPRPADSSPTRADFASLGPASCADSVPPADEAGSNF